MFEPSSYSYGAADYSQLATSALEIGGSLASQAIAQSGHHAKARHKAKMEEIAAETPDHSPMWPIAIGIVVAAGIGFYVYNSKKAA